MTAQGAQIVVKQGQPAGVLWFHPKVVDRTGKTTRGSVSPTAVDAPSRPARCPATIAGGRPGLCHEHHHNAADDHDDGTHDHDHGGAPATRTAAPQDDDDRPRDDDDGCAMTGRSVPRRRKLPA